MGITHSYAAFAAFSYDSGNIAVRYFLRNDKSTLRSGAHP